MGRNHVAIQLVLSVGFHYVVINPLDAYTAFCSRYKTTKMFRHYINTGMLVFI